MTTEQITMEREALQARVRAASQHVKQLADELYVQNKAIRKVQYSYSSGEPPGAVEFQQMLDDVDALRRDWEAASRVEQSILSEWHKFCEAHPEPRVFHQFNPPVQ